MTACANCTKDHGTIDACVVGVLLGVLSDRIGGLTPVEVAHLVEAVDTDELWDEYLGPAVDKLEGLLTTAPSTA